MMVMMITMIIMMLICKVISCIMQEVGAIDIETGCLEMMILVENVHRCK